MNGEETIFEQALGIESPQAREEFLRHACAEDAAMFERLKGLLRAHDRAGKFADPIRPDCVSPLVGSESSTTAAIVLTEKPGDHIGRYKLLEQIGEGGFGVVWMAEQEEPVRRRVALKIIKLGMDTRTVVARFEAERQALALMDHPNIARVFDGGATETGRPYFVMELVRGLPLTKYCDETKMSTRERLELFGQVCRAVQHAHQKGIIHRDLKPSNILVTEQDGRPVPKVIDFGVAKATEGRLTDKTLFTGFQQLIGTPTYMSPEQAGLGGLDIDTRSDTYSLGVVLYELLTGRPPFDTQTLLKEGYEAVLRAIREVDPPKPSTRLSTLQQGDLLTAAQRRQTDPPKLVHLLRGDLDWIVMKCLEKDRNQRYETANGLASDIERYLHEEPVLARPPSAVYRCRKFARKHRTAITAMAAFVLLLIAAASVSLGLALWATRERDRAKKSQVAEVAQRKRAEHQEANAISARRRAEAALTRLEIERAENLLAGDNSSLGLAYLARLLKQQPTNRAVAERLLSALSHRNFCLPATPALQHEGPLDVQSMAALSGRAGSIRMANFSPDSQRIVTASRDGTARIWDVRSGLSVSEPLRHTGAVMWAQFSFDGQHVVTASTDGTARVWEAHSGKPAAPPLRHDGPVLFAEFSPDASTVVTASKDHSVQMWVSHTGARASSAFAHPDAVYFARFSPGGDRVLTACADNQARVWSVLDGAVVASLEHRPHPEAFGCFPQFSPQGDRIATVEQRGVLIWDGWNKQLPVVRLKHEFEVVWLEFSPDGQTIATACWDNSGHIWDVRTGKAVIPPVRHQNWVQSVDFSADGLRLLTASRDKTVRLWNTQNGRPLTEPLRAETQIWHAQFSSNGQRATAISEGYQTWLWDIRCGQPLSLSLHHGGDVRHAVFSPDGQRVATASWDGTARVWDARSGLPLTAPLLHGGDLFDVEFSSDGSRLATVGSQSARARVWEAASGESVGVPSQHQERVYGVGFSPDGQRIVSASHDGTARVWDVQHQKLLFQLRHGERVNSAEFSPDGQRLVTASYDGTACIWNAANGARLTEPLKHDAYVFLAEFSRDSEQIVTASKDMRARIWNALTGQLATKPLRHADELHEFNSARFSPDGTKVATAAGQSAQIWDARTGEPLIASLKHLGRVNSVRFSPDGHRLVTACHDGSVRVWDVATGHPLSEPLRHETQAHYAEFSPDGRFIVSCSTDETARIWELPFASLPILDWLPELAEAVAGQEIDDRDVITVVVVDELFRLKQKLLADKSQAYYSVWANWLFGDSATRAIWPSSQIVVPEVLERRAEEALRRQARKHTDAGRGLAKQKRWTEAIAEFSRALEVDSEHGNGYLFRADAYLHLADFEKAKADFHIAEQTADALSLNALAWEYVGGAPDSRFPEQALPLALKAATLTQQHSELNTLGIVYYRLGEWAKSVEILQRAVEAEGSGGKAFDFYFLAMSYQRLGDSLNAQRYFAKANDWVAGRTHMSANWRKQLATFRAEAEAALGAPKTK